MNPATTVKPIVIVASKVTEEPIKPNKSMFHHVKHPILKSVLAALISIGHCNIPTITQLLDGDIGLRVVLRSVDLPICQSVDLSDSKPSGLDLDEDTNDSSSTIS
ncbi:11521_t:CDS:2, partial [Rhizophagus irregularis]